MHTELPAGTMRTHTCVRACIHTRRYTYVHTHMPGCHESECTCTRTCMRARACMRALSLPLSCRILGFLHFFFIKKNAHAVKDYLRAAGGFEDIEEVGSGGGRVCVSVCLCVCVSVSVPVVVCLCVCVSLCV